MYNIYVLCATKSAVSDKCSSEVNINVTCRNLIINTNLSMYRYQITVLSLTVYTWLSVWHELQTEQKMKL